MAKFNIQIAKKLEVFSKGKMCDEHNDEAL